MSKYITDLQRDLAINHKKIEATTSIDQMPPGEPWDTIKALYSGGTLIEKVLATLFNAIATSKKRRFLMGNPCVSGALT